jgi:rSAM/selenodomain-associated transferase 2
MNFSWSVVVPVLNEMDRLEVFMVELEKLGPCEKLLIDGGSHDGSWEYLQEMEKEGRVVVRQTIANRGLQIREGIENSSGKHILILHVDSRLPERPFADMDRLLAEPSVSAGAFRFRVEALSRNTALMEKLVNWRSRVFQMPYGDQGLFFTREIYLKCGGMEAIPLMEDISLCRRLKKWGEIRLLDKCLFTSGRRIENRGFWRSCVLNVILVLLYHAGVSPDRLKVIYEK